MNTRYLLHRIIRFAGIIRGMVFLEEIWQLEVVVPAGI